MGTQLSPGEEPPPWHLPIARFSHGGEAVGTGFLTLGHRLLTCAHVIANLLKKRGLRAETGTHLTVDFPWAELENVPVRLCDYRPMIDDKRRRRKVPTDIALLELLEPLAFAAEPYRVRSPKAPSFEEDPPAPVCDMEFTAWGFPAGKPNGTRAHGVLGDEDAGGWLHAEAETDRAHFIAPGFSGAPVFRRGGPSATAREVYGMCASVDKQSGRVGRIIPASHLLEVVRRSTCPFSAGGPFEAHHAPFFHGRDQFCLDVLSKLRETGLVVLVGAPKSGRTSILRAGLRRAKVGSYYPLSIVLEAYPDPRARFAQALELPESAPDSAIDDAIGRWLRVGGLVLVVEPADFLATTLQPDRSRDFLGLVQKLIEAHKSSRGARFAVVLSVSRESFSRLEVMLPGKPSELEPFVVGPLGYEHLKAVVRGPTLQLGVDFAENLVERICNDFVRSETTLCELQECLESLWAQGHVECMIEEKHFLGFGGIKHQLDLTGVALKALSDEPPGDPRADRTVSPEEFDGPAPSAEQAGLAKRQEVQSAAAVVRVLTDDKTQLSIVRALSLFEGDFSLAAAAEVASIGRVEASGAGPVLESLCQLGAAMRTDSGASPPRYALVPGIRDAVMNARPNPNDLAGRRRFVAFFQRLAEDCEPFLMSPHRNACLDMLDGERRNLRAALDYAAAAPELAQEGLSLAGALFWFWNLRAHFSEGRELVQALLDSADAADPKACAKVHYAAGGLAFLQGDIETARDWLDDSVKQWRALGDGPDCQRRLAYALVILGRVQQDFTLARKLEEEAVEIFGRLNDTWGLALALNDLGYVVAATGDYPRGSDYYARSIGLWRQQGDLWGLALALVNYGALAIEQEGLLSEARRALDEALTSHQVSGDAWGAPNTLKFFGKLEAREGRTDVALEYYRESLRRHGDLGRKQLIVDCLMSIARLLTQRTPLEKHDAIQAVRLFAVSEREVDFMKAPFPKDELDANKRCIAMLEQQLHRATYRSAWSAGRGLTLEDALNYALVERPGST